MTSSFIIFPLLLAVCDANMLLEAKLSSSNSAVQSNADSRVCHGGVLRVEGNSFIQAMKTKNLRRVLTNASETQQHQNQDVWNPTSPADLEKKYHEIFKTSNRNAASHLWASYILQRKTELTHAQISMLFTGFCPVSGSPLSRPEGSRYFSQLPGATVAGYTYHCCWPCICDLTDLVKVDTKTITDSSGTDKQYHFTVIGDPCEKAGITVCNEKGEAGCIPYEAPEVVCEGTSLKGATLSDAGHIIIGIYEVGGSYTKNDYIDYETESDDDGNTLKSSCEDRASNGYGGGMGEIFRQVAELSPL